MSQIVSGVSPTSGYTARIQTIPHLDQNIQIQSIFLLSRQVQRDFLVSNALSLRRRLCSLLCLYQVIIFSARSWLKYFLGEANYDGAPIIILIRTDPRKLSCTCKIMDEGLLEVSVTGAGAWVWSDVWPLAFKLNSDFDTFPPPSLSARAEQIYQI